VPQKILDVLLPSGVASEIRCSSHPPGLKEACGVPFLQSNREAGVPSVHQPDFAPVACYSDLRISLGDCVDRTPQESQRLGAPATKGLDGEGHKAASR